MNEKKKQEIPMDFKLDDFFTTQETRDDDKKEKVENISLSLIDDFKEHPFKVIENDEYYIEYFYNANGVRTNKRIDTRNKVTHIEYTLNGTNILEEKRYTNLELTETLKYYYDSSDNIIGFTYNGEEYLYLKNIQSDITGIIDENNNLVVEYNYDGYGNIISMVDNTTNKIGEKNPYRYRSYYYDTETTWYYLNSRYYDSSIGRFITMDEIEYLGSTSTLLSYNLFTYCEGNPVNKVDSFGTWPEWLDIDIEEIKDVLDSKKNGISGVESYGKMRLFL